MYNKYMTDLSAFSDLYREVEEEEDVAAKVETFSQKRAAGSAAFDIKKIFKILDSENSGPLPLILLLLLLADVEEDEWLIIMALVAVFGI